ncbi:MAG: hypothetical protein ACKPKO_35920, partial [Candidatus Fonsibacter sp.]
DSTKQLIRTVCNDHNANLDALDAQSENINTGARLHLWLNSMFAGRSKAKYTDPKADNRQCAILTQASTYTTSTNHIGKYCMHDWLLAKHMYRQIGTSSTNMI